MIPKVIHYCWFGGKPKPKLAEKCIASWKKYCPDYQIIEWNEGNFNVNLNGYTQRCYAKGQWAFLSDYVRLYVVEQQGGFYFDTDVELLKPLTELEKHEAFFGFETEAYIATGLGFGSEAGGKAIRAMLAQYNPWVDGNAEPIGCPTLNTLALEPFGLKKDGSRQRVAEAEIYPAEYFNPLEDATGVLRKTENTVSVHWYMKSALNKKIKLRSKLTRPLHRLFGTEVFHRNR